MKITRSTLLAALICLMLVCAALCIGAVRGWSSQRRDALSALTEDGAMRTAIEYRGMDAANLAVVAARHLPADDPDLLALQQASATLLSGTRDTETILQADAEITRVAGVFAEKLPDIASVQRRSRDADYVRSLTAALSMKNSASYAISQLAENFNHGLSTTLLGKLAGLLGVDPIPAGTGLD